MVSADASMAGTPDAIADTWTAAAAMAAALITG